MRATVKTKVMTSSNLTIAEPVHAEIIRSPLDRSWFVLLLLGALSAVLSVVIVLQITLVRPSPGRATALRSVLIPSAGPIMNSQAERYRFFIAQLVQRNRSGDFFAGRELSDLILRVSIQEKIDPLLIAAVVHAESTFMNQAVSNRGARGLMQIRARTAQYVSGMIDLPWQGERSLHDPEYNLRLGIGYLKYLSKKFDGNIERMLAAYNWGPSNVAKAKITGSGLPSATRKYVGTVMANHKRWKREVAQQWALAGRAAQEEIA